MCPLISVVIPIYNTEKYLPNAVESVLSQSMPDFELLLIDDGSTDSSAAIIDAYAKKDPRVKAFHKPNGGTYTGYNMGIEQASGKYVVFAASDDFFDEKAFEIIAEQSNTYDFDIIFMNVVTHSCDEAQNIIVRDIQGSVMKEKFEIIGKREIENNWHYFMSLGLTRNPVNAYKASIIKKYRFRTDVYGADFLMNIAIADEIKSASCHPANLYHGLIYQSVQSESFNISTGKYNSYEHQMFNDFYMQYKQLFSSWGLLNERLRNRLAGLRLDLFETQLSNIFAWNNRMTYLQNICKVASYFDDVLLEACEILECRKETESRILSVCLKLMSDPENQRDKKKYQTHWVAKLIDAITLTTRPTQINLKMVSALFDEENPYRVGISFYDEFCSTNPDEGDMAALTYLKTEECAWKSLLTGDYALAVEKIESLFQSPYSDPVKYILLSRYFLCCGLEEDAKQTLALGHVEFPNYKGFIEAHQ